MRAYLNRSCISLVLVATVVALALPFLHAGDEKAPTPGEDRVKKAKKLLEDGKKYPKGCSEFVSEVLGISWQSANDLLGKNPTPVDDLKKLKPGDVVGWKSTTGSGHVAIYLGEGDKVFIDVKGENEKPRTLKSYGEQKLVKSDKY